MLETLRALVRDINFSQFGLVATVTPYGGSPVETRVIWLTPASPGVPSGAQFVSAEPRRLMAVRRDDVPSLPRGSTVEITEILQTSPGVWSVDSTEDVFEDHIRVSVVPATLGS